MVGFELSKTLSEYGSVARGVCRSSENGYLESVTEMTKIFKTGTGAENREDESAPVKLTGAERVSMNMWGFGPEVFGPLREEFSEFLKRSDLARDEYPLPAAIHRAVRHHEMRVEVLKPESQWFGVTHPDDAPAVRAALAKLVAEGHYPAMRPR